MKFQRVGDDWQNNGDVAFLFWATCLTGTAAVGGDSTGAVGRRVSVQLMTAEVGS